MAYKLFSTGEVLTAANVNSYLMNQTVMVFASAAARTAALSGVLAEGMISYRTDSHILEYYDGTSWSSVSTSNPISYGFSAGKNKIINGDFGVWQRGTSITVPTTTGTYTSDRWFCYSTHSAGTASVSQQTFTPGTAPVAGYEGTYFARFTAGSTTTQAEFGQKLEDVRIFAGQTVTLSFWAKASVSTSVPITAIQNFGSGGSANVNTSGTTQTITTSWARYSTSITIPSIIGKTIGTSSYLYLQFYMSPPASSQTFDIWGVQLETGSTATAFQTATGTVQGELAACQRYYYRSPLNSNSSSYFIAGAYSTTAAVGVMSLPVSLRVAPTSIDTNSLRLFEFATGSGLTAATFTVSSTQSVGNTMEVTATYGSAAFTAGRTYLVSANGGTGFIGFGAEL
jgi:Carbohydrate binding domain